MLRLVAKIRIFPAGRRQTAPKASCRNPKRRRPAQIGPHAEQAPRRAGPNAKQPPRKAGPTQGRPHAKQTRPKAGPAQGRPGTERPDAGQTPRKAAPTQSSSDAGQAPRRAGRRFCFSAPALAFASYDRHTPYFLRRKALTPACLSPAAGPVSPLFSTVTPCRSPLSATARAGPQSCRT